MVFVDASALIALVAREADAVDLADRLEAASPRLCSAISVWEAVAGLCRSYRFSVPEAQASVKALMAALDIQIDRLKGLEPRGVGLGQALYGNDRRQGVIQYT